MQGHTGCALDGHLGVFAGDLHIYVYTYVYMYMLVFRDGG